MKTLSATAATLTLLLGLAGCGDDTGGASATGAQPSGLATYGSQDQPRQVPGTSGEVAQVSGRTMQVQNPTSGQVAVTWTKDTTFTQQVAATLADLSVGDCVMVSPSADSAASQSSDPIQAGQVRILPASEDGTCTPTGGGMGAPGDLQGGGPGLNGDGGTPPSGMPTGMPTDLPSDGSVRMMGAFGTVTKVSGTGFTVSTAMPSAPGATESTPTAVTVEVTDDTDLTRSGTATSNAVKVGVCVDARGQEDATGAITATSIAVSPKVDGECSTGFGSGPIMQQAG